MYTRYTMYQYKYHIRAAFFSLIILLAGCAAPRPDITIPAQMPPAPKIKQPVHVALVLGGGGARGIAHAGVLKVLEEEHVPIDLIVGTSAGSIVGALYADDPNADRVQELLMSAKKKDFVDISLLHTFKGLISGNALQNYLLANMQHQDFDGLKIPFIAVATDITTGNAIELAGGPVAPAVNASSALPPYFRPVNLYGHRLVDGGVSEPVPVPTAKKYKPDIIIAVNISRESDGKTPNNILRVSTRSAGIIGAKLAKLQTQMADIAIYPEVGSTTAFDGSNREELYQAGQHAMRAAMPKLKQLLAEHHDEQHTNTTRVGTALPNG